ncbi:MAG TPA: class I SAM-dependent methyltransferase [Cellvibrionaceae bacterium]|nr:class I SAM-dependent methyltransferase [Cellvibrionaceae bacterium]HMW73571.1 class I SAM-dependent methyltransferase [Cellvibrionaceae bacterium]HNG59649.1 class I SAM-dependent methyltransferase [Cellvibrionaceae bacterium]
MSRRTLNLDDRLYNYIVANSLREHPELATLRAATSSWPRANMQISPEQGQFMALLTQLSAAKRAIEIGVFTGYSALAVALALPADGYLLACDISAEDTDLGIPHWQAAGVAHKIDFVVAPAVATLTQRVEQGEANSYDFAFIDADKTAYDSYYELCLQLLKPGGLIAIDNVLWSGQVALEQIMDADTEALKALNRKIHQDARVDMVLLPISDGLTLVRKRG